MEFYIYILAEHVEWHKIILNYFLSQRIFIFSVYVVGTVSVAPAVYSVDYVSYVLFS